jgi:hypothetical protein
VENYEAVSSCMGKSIILLITKGVIDLLAPESDSASRGDITHETLEKRIPATERCTLSSLSQVHQEIAATRKKAVS